MSSRLDGSKLQVTEQASTPATPDTGQIAIYAKTDKKFYTLDDTGAETELGTPVSLPLVETDGGTGQTTYTAGDILYSDATNSLAKLPIGTAGQVLQVSGGLPSWQTGGGSGTVTSVAAGTGLTATPSPITTTGTISLSVPVSEANGGTGETTYTTGDMLYATASNNLGKLTIGSAGQVLTVAGGVPTWSTDTGTGTVTSVGLSTDSGFLTVGSSPVTTSGTITLNKTGGLTANQVVATPDGTTGVVSVRSLVNNDLPTVVETKGGTNQTTYTTGDILYASASNTLSKLGIGASNEVLKVSGGVPVWGTVSSAGGAWTTLTGWTALGAAGTTISLTSISGSYTHLKILLKASFNTASNNIVYIRFNSDNTVANYTYQTAQVVTTTVSGATTTNSPILANGGSTANTWSTAEITIFDYTNNTSQRNWHSFFLSRGTITSGHYHGLWTNTSSAITQVDLVTSGNNFIIGTSYMLLGCV